MDILGDGPLELIFILMIALIVLGPKDMVKAGRTIGRTLRKIVTSPTWRAVQQTSRDLRNLPNKLIRDAGLEEDVQELEKSLKLQEIGKDLKKTQAEIQSGLSSDLSDWTTPPDENSIAPPHIPPESGATIQGTNPEQANLANTPDPDDALP